MTDKFTTLSANHLTLDFEPLKLKCMRDWLYREENVKEFIRLLKNEIHKRDLDNYMGLCYTVIDIDSGKGIVLSDWIDKLAGDKLI
jgi:hypothetical protein